MLNQMLLLYYPTRHTWLTLHTIVSVVLCRINLPHTYTEHCDSPGGTGGPDTADGTRRNGGVRDGGGAPSCGSRITGVGEYQKCVCWSGETDIQA